MDSEFNPAEILLVFGSNIKKSREMQGYSISDLATSIEYDRGCLSALEYGEQNIEYLLKFSRTSCQTFHLHYTKNLRIFYHSVSFLRMTFL